MSLDDSYHKVELLHNDSWTDVTSQLISIQSCKLQATGLISVANLELNAEDGNFITQNMIIDEFDKLRFTFNDDANNEKVAIFEVDTLLSQETVKGKLILPIELKGRERAMQDMKTTAYYFFKSPYFIINDLINRYNRRKGSEQPIISSRVLDDGVSLECNKAPKTINMVADFSAEWTYYDAIMHIIERLAEPRDSGGYGEYFTLRFEHFNDAALTIHIDVQGGAPATLPIIKSTLDKPIHQITSRVESTTATLVLAQGKQDEGTVPSNPHRYSSIIEFYERLPKFDISAVYEQGIMTNYQGNRYRAKSDVPLGTLPTNSLYWESITEEDLLGDDFIYSPVTNNKSALWKNCCSNPENAFATGTFDDPAFPDGNLIIRSTVLWRDFADFRAVNDETIGNDNTLKHYLYQHPTQGTYNGIHVGLKILVDSQLGALGGSFIENGGLDKNGKQFKDSLVVWDGDEWIVIFDRVEMHSQYDNERLYQVAILNEGKVYEYNFQTNSQGLFPSGRYPGSRNDHAGTPNISQFRYFDISGEVAANDCFHHPISITNTEGLLRTINKSDDTTFGENSAVRIRFQYTATTALNSAASLFAAPFVAIAEFFSDLTSDDATDNTGVVEELLRSTYYDVGWWCAMRFPFPFNTLNGIIEDKGDIFGGGYFTRNEFAAIDFTNANYTQKGETGYNSDNDEDLGSEYTGFTFWGQWIFHNGNGKPIGFQGDVPFTITLYDIEGNVFRTDFIYRIHGDVEQFRIPFSSFTVERPSYTQHGVLTALVNFPKPTFEVRNIFEERKVLLMTIQTKDSYDDGDRYAPLRIETITNTFLASGALTIDGFIDGFAFMKAPLATSGKVTDRVIQGEIVQQPLVRNLLQLENIAKAEHRRQSHRFETYEVETDYDCSLREEQAVYLEHPEIINHAEGSGINAMPNTRNLVVKTLNFTYNAEGSAGPLLFTTLARRVNPPVG